MTKSTSKALYGWVLALITGAFFIVLLTYLPVVSEHGAITFSFSWLPQLRLSLSFYLDGLALLFGLIILGVGAIVLLYAAYYFDSQHELIRFYKYILPFMVAMFALVLSGNLLTLFIAWELTSVLSFLLISFHGTKPEARSGALQALIITGGGGLALLVGLVLLGTASGSMEINQILTNESLRENPWYGAFTILIFVACFSKSAQFPLHFWLPGAMSAPTPASAYLHSATMVKAGIFLLLRFSPVLGGTPLWETTLMSVGLVTMLIGALFAVRQRDLKAALAYSTISQLGALVLLIGLPNGEGVTAAIVALLAHSLYKAALFLVAGAIDHATGTRNLDALGGLARYMPGWAVVAVIASLSMAGIPPLLGFVAKESLLHSLEEFPLALMVVVCSAAFTVTLALILTWDVFWGTYKEQHHFHMLPRGMVIGPAVLVSGSLLAGLMLQVFVEPLLVPIVGHDLHLALFSGINLPLILSIIVIVSGIAIFAARHVWRSWTYPRLPQGTEVYNNIIHRVENVGDLVLKTQGGKLRYYLLVILTSVCLLLATAGFDHFQLGNITFQFNGSIDFLRTLLLILALSAMLASILIKNHLIAALSLGVSGYCIGGLFLIEPAPDVALVQFMVETVGTILLIVMLARIRASERQAAMDALWKQSRLGLARDVMLATVIGLGVTMFTLAALNSRPTPTIASWHIENALSIVGVDDVVGAIVTDFRGLDTIIEITVFSVAALGVLTLLSLSGRRPPLQLNFRKAVITFQKYVRRNIAPNTAFAESNTQLEDKNYEDGPLLESALSTPLTRTIARFILPIAFLVALVQLLYGGDMPGDGFTAGVISGLGVALWYIVFGYHEAQRRLGWLHPPRLIGAGLTLVLANAVFPLLLGEPFLSHISIDQIHLPANLHFSSTVVYETGIFLTVLGGVSMVMESIAYPKEIEAL